MSVDVIFHLQFFNYKCCLIHNIQDEVVLCLSTVWWRHAKW